MNAINRYLCVVAAMTLVCGLAAPTIAAENADPAVQSGHDALGPSGKFPWYDADKDALRPIPLSTAPPRNDDSKTHPPSSHHGGHSQHGTGSGDGNGEGSDGGADNSPSQSPSWSFDPSAGNLSFLVWIVWIVIALLLLWLAWMLIRAYLNREAKDAKESETLGDDEAVPSALPVASLPKTPSSFVKLLEEARRLYEAARYSEAIICLFSYELLKLDHNQLIRLARGKTNRQYLREISSRPELHEILAKTLIPFEDAYFGDHELDRERFETVWKQMDRFNSLLEAAWFSKFVSPETASDRKAGARG